MKLIFAFIVAIVASGVGHAQFSRSPAFGGASAIQGKPAATPPGGSSKAFVGHTLGTGSSSATTRTVTRTMTSGNFAMAVLKWEDAARTPTVSDDKGNVWTAMTQTNYSSQPYGQMFFATNLVSGATVITANFGSATAYCVVHTAEFSGVQLAAPLDSQTWTNGTLNTTVSPNFTTTTENGLLVAFVAYYNSSGTFTPKSGWTEAWDNDAAAYGTHFQYFLNTAAGTHSGANTSSDAQVQAFFTGAFK